MRRLVFLGLLSTGFASAVELVALPLKGYKLCIVSQPVSLADADRYLLSTAEKDLADWLKINLSAYKLYREEDCKSGLNNAYVEVSIGLTSAINSFNRGYFIQTRVTTLDFRNNGIITLWDTLTYGITAKRDREVFDSFKSTIGEQITKLAADFNSANP